MKTIKDIKDVKGKRVLIRCDFNVPMKNGRVVDNNRIVGALKTIKYFLRKKCKVVLMSHLGRPKGKVVEELRLNGVAKELSKLLEQDVMKLNENSGELVKAVIEEMNEGEVVILENIQFNPLENENSVRFAKELSGFADFFVLDAFGQAHRKYTSINKICKVMDSYAGYLLEKEIKELSKLENGKKPYIAILGGAKVSDKIKLIEKMLTKVDALLLGGAMIFTFYKAMGLEVGNSIVEDEQLKYAKRLLKKSKSKLVLPVDVVVANSFDKPTKIKTVLIDNIPKNMIGLDIGPETTSYYNMMLDNAKTVLWNGPMGLFEVKPFDKGTKAVAKKLASIKAVTVVGGGDSANAIKKMKLVDNFTHISTGGGASLEFIEGKKLPGLQYL